MSEQELADTAPQPSAGALLREARVAAGLHIAALAVALKVPVKKMEALEQDRFELLPDLVFARALACSVCRVLKIDPAEILERLPKNNTPTLAYAGAGINMPFRPSGRSLRTFWWGQVSRTAMMTGAVLLLGVAVLLFLPFIKQHLSAFLPDTPLAASQTTPLSTDPALASGSINGLSLISTVLSPAEPVAAVEPIAPSGSASMAAALVLSKVEASSSTAPGVTATDRSPFLSSAATSVAGATGSANVVQFRAKGESWVEVTDAKGVVVLRRTLADGEVTAAAGVLPLSVIVGRADATQVQVRGKLMDLSKISRDNVARFEVK